MHTNLVHIAMVVLMGSLKHNGKEVVQMAQLVKTEIRAAHLLFPRPVFICPDYSGIVNQLEISILKLLWGVIFVVLVSDFLLIQEMELLKQTFIREIARQPKYCGLVTTNKPTIIGCYSK